MAGPSFFATTHWTIVRDAARGGNTLAADVLGSCIRTYWQPLYRYTRPPFDSCGIILQSNYSLLRHSCQARSHETRMVHQLRRQTAMIRYRMSRMVRKISKNPSLRVSAEQEQALDSP